MGERLLRLEGIDLRGVSYAGFILQYSQAAQDLARRYYVASLLYGS